MAGTRDPCTGNTAAARGDLARAGTHGAPRWIYSPTSTCRKATAHRWSAHPTNWAETGDETEMDDGALRSPGDPGRI